mmetsp:Transcript_8782/g.14604  ORF Transcript_8782/g.14604 Transcript_8782/m.14604 type:complete len:92 (-) Transcript_8782:229-504(-)
MKDAKSPSTLCAQETTAATVCTTQVTRNSVSAIMYQLSPASILKAVEKSILSVKDLLFGIVPMASENKVPLSVAQKNMNNVQRVVGKIPAS